MKTYIVVSESYKPLQENKTLEALGCIVVTRTFSGRDGEVTVYMLAIPEQEG